MFFSKLSCYPNHDLCLRSRQISENLSKVPVIRSLKLILYDGNFSCTGRTRDNVRRMVANGELRAD